MKDDEQSKSKSGEYIFFLCFIQQQKAIVAEDGLNKNGIRLLQDS